MQKVMFESDIPSWCNPVKLAERIALWVQGGINTVMLQVDDGHGTTWPSALAPSDPRISLAQEPLKVAVKMLHDAGLRAVLTFNVCGIYRPDTAIKPEFLLSSYQFQAYDPWNPAFRTWRAAYIAECATYVDADAIGLDYIRSGREQISEPITATAAIALTLQAIRSAVDQCYPLVSITHSSFSRVPAQGINTAGWIASGDVYAACLFNYTSPFPVADFATLPASQVIAMSGNYDSTVNGVTTRSGMAVAKDWRRIMKQTPTVGGVGLYLANLYNADQAEHTKPVELVRF